MARGVVKSRGTVAVDFDGVVHAYSRGWEDGSIYDGPKPEAIASLRELMRLYAVFVHTSRNPRQVARWLTAYGFECVTRYPRRRTFWTTGGVLLVTNRKLPAVAYIDDRAIRFTDWPQALGELGITRPPA